MGQLEKGPEGTGPSLHAGESLGANASTKSVDGADNGLSINDVLSGLRALALTSLATWGGVDLAKKLASDSPATNVNLSALLEGGVERGELNPPERFTTEFNTLRSVYDLLSGMEKAPPKLPNAEAQSIRTEAEASLNSWRASLKLCEESLVCPEAGLVEKLVSRFPDLLSQSSYSDKDRIDISVGKSALARILLVMSVTD